MERDYEVTNSELNEIFNKEDIWNNEGLIESEKALVEELTYFEYNRFV